MRSLSMRNAIACIRSRSRLLQVGARPPIEVGVDYHDAHACCGATTAVRVAAADLETPSYQPRHVRVHCTWGGKGERNPKKQRNSDETWAPIPRALLKLRLDPLPLERGLEA